MQFNSYLFAAFLVVVLAVYNLPALTWRGQKWWLLVTSYAFYAAWDPVFIVLVWLSTVIDWKAERRGYERRMESRMYSPAEGDEVNWRQKRAAERANAGDEVFSGWGQAGW